MLSALRKFVSQFNMKLDSAVIKALSLDPKNSSVAAHGGGGMSSATTLKISTTTADGNPYVYFMKTGVGPDAQVMFEGEYASLNAIHNAVPSLCPAALAWGQLTEAPNKYFLVTDFLDLTSRRTSSNAPKSGNAAPSLAAKMAKLHMTPAPIPAGHDKPMFGFPATTCCGDTPQENGYKASWAEFYGENRLGAILRQCEKNNGKDKELRDTVTKVVERVVPRLIGDAHLNGGKGVTPVVVHGDLWSGNVAKGIIGGNLGGGGQPEDVVYDPSACYAHNEYELGIMKMFGGFGSALGGFFSEYHKLCPKTEPVDEYEDRVALYELYHHLNHLALFGGGGYRGGAMSIMKTLVKKYGQEKTEL